MAFGEINAFLSNAIVYGGARPSRFDVQVTIPAIGGVPSLTSVASQIKFSCMSASIPSYKVGVVPVPYFGRYVKVSGDRTWDDWEIQVLVDEDFATRSLFEAWSNSMNALELNTNSMASTQAYKTPWTITQYGQNNNVLRQYNLIGAWPSIIGPIKLDWEATNRIETFSVSVPFDDCVPLFEGTYTTTTSYAANTGQNGTSETTVSTTSGGSGPTSSV